MNADEVIELARRLSRADRALVIRTLIADLDPPVEDQAAIDDAWSAEIARRVEDIRQGRVMAGTWDEAMARARQRLEDRRRSKSLP